jgi:hypothetical protein
MVKRTVAKTVSGIPTAAGVMAKAIVAKLRKAQEHHREAL